MENCILHAGKFGKLQAGDIIIAPVRTYQKKIAVVTPQAESFLYSKDFIVLRKIGSIGATLFIVNI